MLAVLLSEQFQFDMLVQELTVRREGRLIFRDRFCWRGPWDAATAAWHFGGGVACGNLFVALPLERIGHPWKRRGQTESSRRRAPTCAYAGSDLPRWWHPLW